MSQINVKKKIPMQAHANNLRLNYNEDEILCPIELMLISKIIPFMFIVARHQDTQHGLKGQSVVVPTDLIKFQKVLRRSSSI